MSESRCGDGARWCARADEMFDGPGLHVLEVDPDDELPDAVAVLDAFHVVNAALDPFRGYANAIRDETRQGLLSGRLTP